MFRLMGVTLATTITLAFAGGASAQMLGPGETGPRAAPPPAPVVAPAPVPEPRRARPTRKPRTAKPATAAPR